MGVFGGMRKTRSADTPEKPRKLGDPLGAAKRERQPNQQQQTGDPNKSNWEKISSRDLGEQRATRDIQGAQQLDRSQIGDVRTSAVPNVLAALAGVLAMAVAYLALGLLMFVGSLTMQSLGGGSVTGSQGQEQGQVSFTPEQIQQRYGIAPYYIASSKPYGDGFINVECWYESDPNGQPYNTDPNYCVESVDRIPVPDWYQERATAAMMADPEVAPLLQTAGEGSAATATAQGPAEVSSTSALSYIFGHFTWWRLLIALGVGVMTWGITRTVFLRQLAAQNSMFDVADINQHTDDQHIQMPQELMENYSPFPDVGAHSPVSVSSMLGHGMLSNKGIDKVLLPRRAEEDVLDGAGEVIVHAGDVIVDEEGTLEMEPAPAPLFDTEFAHALWEGSGLPKDKKVRRFFDPTKTMHNPGGKNRDITGGQTTLAEHINESWVLPDYEPQRPAGVYVVDEAPVNTMVLAMTRAGKGQTYIEPVIDMWTRELKPNNMVINDPKGELLVKNFVRLTMRGYQVVQFNLINSLKTDIYNPLGMAAEAAREGDSTKCAMYVENIAEVFFPVDGSDDPVWPNAANNAFKRTAYGMIDYYLEQERELRQRAVFEEWDQKVLDTKIDKMWGNVTLFNCYLFFVQLSAKKLPNPQREIADKINSGELSDFEAADLQDEISERVKLWDGQDELDMLTLFFNATDALPVNGMRNLVSNSDKALRAMGGAEKMLASVYGIAITAMSFFTDPTISTLTSGTLSQNTDLGSLSFPRRFGVRFAQNYVRRMHLIGAQVTWDCWEDAAFTVPLEGTDFTHHDTLSREGWARAYFKGIFPTEVTYLRLQVLNSTTGNLMKTFYFKYTKAYQTNLRGTRYIKDPIKDTKIVKNGILVELQRKQRRNGGVVYTAGPTTFEREVLSLSTMSMEQLRTVDEQEIEKMTGVEQAIMSTSVRYSEQPKAVFLVTPPHLMKYAKIILILLKQLVDLNFDKSYMTKSNQKPLYKTRFMLDELGNLQSEGNGIAGFETMLSIGLGQEQQFTLILQTLQQLKDVYGESVDKIVQGNAQPLTSAIATPSGWTTMGEIEQGDQVLLPKGGSAPVTGVYPKGERKVYRITRADGSTTLACDEHLWAVDVIE